MSIRLRLAVVFKAAAALLFALGSWLFVAELSASLLGSIDAQLASQLSRAARYVPASPAHTSPPPGPGSPAPGEYVVQVIDPAGRVRGGSADAGTTPLLSQAQISRARQHGFAVTRSDEDEQERVKVRPLAGHPGWVAVASVDLEAFDRTRSDVTRELVIAGVVFVAAAGLGGYGLARAALSPVERLRREVASVSARDPAPSLQVPRTRDEIAALAATMNELLGRLQGSLARQRALVADASHELRTTFAVLRGEVELASRPGRREELAAAVDRASEESPGWRASPSSCCSARSDEDGSSRA
jgi:HAMP domain-containing protein